MEQPAESIQDSSHHALGDRAGAWIAEPRLGELDVPVAELAPGEFADPPGGLGEPECLQVGRGLGDRLVEPGENPAVFNGQLVENRGAGE